MHKKVFGNQWCSFRICGHVITCCFSQSLTRACRRVTSAEHTAIVLMDYHIRCGIRPATENEAKIDLGRVILPGESHPLYPLSRRTCAVGSAILRKSGFWSRSCPTNRDWFKNGAWSLAASLKTRRTLPGLFGLITGWCWRYHSRSNRKRGSCDLKVTRWLFLMSSLFVYAYLLRNTGSLLKLRSIGLNWANGAYYWLGRLALLSAQRLGKM